MCFEEKFDFVVEYDFKKFDREAEDGVGPLQEDDFENKNEDL